MLWYGGLAAISFDTSSYRAHLPCTLCEGNPPAPIWRQELVRGHRIDVKVDNLPQMVNPSIGSEGKVQLPSIPR